jgi:hypothetical protein
MTFIIIFKKLHNINFVKIIVVGPKTFWYPKLNVPWFWNNYCMYYNIKPKSAPKGATIVCFHPFTPYYKISALKIVWSEKKNTKHKTWIIYLWWITKNINNFFHNFYDHNHGWFFRKRIPFGKHEHILRYIFSNILLTRYYGISYHFIFSHWSSINKRPP